MKPCCSGVAPCPAIVRAGFSKNAGTNGTASTSRSMRTRRKTSWRTPITCGTDALPAHHPAPPHFLPLAPPIRRSPPPNAGGRFASRINPSQSGQKEAVMPLSTPTPASPEQDPQQTLFNRAIILSLTMSCLGTRRKVSTTSIETDADKALLHVSKDILDSPELSAIHHLDGSIRKYLKARGLPSPLKHGCYLLPIDLIEPGEQRLGERFAERETAVGAFMTAYPAKVEDIQRRLGPLFDATDYPDRKST